MITTKLDLRCGDEIMPYNYKGDLYKREIVNKSQDMELDVKSVNTLNKIMEKMGLLIHYVNGWGTTDAGAKFSMLYNSMKKIRRKLICVQY